MTYLANYAACCFFVFTYLAWIDRHELREAYVLTILWPVVLPLATGYHLVRNVCKRFGWKFDFDTSPKGRSVFGIRNPDDGWPGLAIRGFGIELMFWKDREKQS